MTPADHAAIVTGAASGLGAATARALAASGARVALLDLSAERLEPLAEEIGGLPFTCDVSDAASVDRALTAARKSTVPPASSSTALALRQPAVSSAAKARCRWRNSPASSGSTCSAPSM
jgi:NAD(P)-dependent dehydrogenase (short-subunit alcohol dehydrogenase family)